MKKHFDVGSGIVIAITFILFFIALLVKGITQDILLEAAVFLVSVKLIMNSYRNNEIVQHLGNELYEIKEILKKS